MYPGKNNPFSSLACSQGWPYDTNPANIRLENFGFPDHGFAPSWFFFILLAWNVEVRAGGEATIWWVLGDKNEDES